MQKMSLSMDLACTTVGKKSIQKKCVYKRRNALFLQSLLFTFPSPFYLSQQQDKNSNRRTNKYIRDQASMSTGKQQHANGRGNGDSTTVDMNHSSPLPRTDAPPPAYSSTPGRGLGQPNDVDEQAPLLGGDRVPSGRVATPAEAAARRATEPRSATEPWRATEPRRVTELRRQLVWWWDDTWRSKFFPPGWFSSIKSKRPLG